MVLVRERCAEQREDTIAGRLHDVAVVTMTASIISFNAGSMIARASSGSRPLQLGRSLDVCEQRRDRLALAFEAFSGRRLSYSNLRETDTIASLADAREVPSDAPQFATESLAWWVIDATLRTKIQKAAPHNRRRISCQVDFRFRTSSRALGPPHARYEMASERASIAITHASRKCEVGLVIPRRNALAGFLLADVLGPRQHRVLARKLRQSVVDCEPIDWAARWQKVWLAQAHEASRTIRASALCPVDIRHRPPTARFERRAAAKVFVTRKRREASRIGGHPMNVPRTP